MAKPDESRVWPARPSVAPAPIGLAQRLGLFTGRSAMRSGVRQLLIGWAAAAVTYGLGALIGVSIG